MAALSKKKSNSVFVPYTADKGDCPFCSEGVLERDSNVESLFSTQEGYSCNSCGRYFIESILMTSNSGTNKPDKKKRYFIPVSKEKSNRLTWF